MLFSPIHISTTKSCTIVQSGPVWQWWRLGHDMYSSSGIHPDRPHDSPVLAEYDKNTLNNKINHKSTGL